MVMVMLLLLLQQFVILIMDPRKQASKRVHLTIVHLCSLQNTSVSVSVLTLSAIAVERWYAICYPLRFRSTLSRAQNMIIIIWIAAMVIALPVRQSYRARYRLVGLVVKASASRAEDSGFESRLRRDFFGV